MPSLSVIIPARNEMWLGRTVDDVLAHARGETEVIAVLDGAWAEPGLERRDNLHVLYLPEPVGQRAATNLGAKVSTADYVMKLDAHCSMKEGFDVELIKTAEELGPDVTQIPSQRNLWVFDRICNGCGKREYQGPTNIQCVACGVMDWRKEVVWKADRRPTDFWIFDSTPHFQYAGSMGHRPEYQGEIADVMSSLGACFFMSRDRFWQLGGLDERHGGWGSFGIEIACKSWLSGGRHVVNRRTFFSHMFRTQGFDFSFPYPMKGSDQEKARQHARWLWFDNNWEKQIRPLSWLIDKFWPIDRWSDEDRALVTAEGDRFLSRMIVGPMVGPTTSDTGASLGTGNSDERLSTMAVSPVDVLIAAPSTEILSERDEFKVSGIATAPIATDVVELRSDAADSFRDGSDKLGIEESVREVDGAMERQGSISAVSSGDPHPAAFDVVDSDFGENPSEFFTVESRDGEILQSSHASTSNVGVGSGAGRGETRFAPHILAQAKDAMPRMRRLGERPVKAAKSIVYYSDCLPPSAILEASRRTIEAANLPIVAVTLKPIDWPAATNIVLPLERSYLSMWRQILAGLKMADSKFVFFTEHDCLMHPSHFDFTPPNDTQVFYNQNIWKVNAETGHALHYRVSQTSGLCANRELLVEHYRKRVAMAEQIADLNWEAVHRMGFEPGTCRRKERVDDLTSDVWMSPLPNVDIRHSSNLTKRDRRASRLFAVDGPHSNASDLALPGWQQSDSIPGWGATRGRFNAFLEEVSRGALQQAIA